MMPDVLFSMSLLQVHDNECIYIPVNVPIYLLDAIYHHAVIGLMHIMEDALVMHIVSIVYSLQHVLQSLTHSNVNGTINILYAFHK